jgi:hypothetical protein
MQDIIKKAIPPDNRAVCPNCGHEFDYNETFHWNQDSDGHPTIESLHCPYCGIGNFKQFECSMCLGQTEGKFKCKLEEECAACATVDYDDFFKEAP